MDVLLLGAAAIVLLVLTIWIVWRPGSSDTASNTQEATGMLPQGDQFEDQYTSATADLSAGGVAVSIASASESEAPVAESSPPVDMPVAQTATTPPWPADTIRTEGSATGFERSGFGPTGVEPIHRTAADDVSRGVLTITRTRLGLGAATLLTVAGAIAGAWLYARIQRERNKPLNRLRRRFR